jgi:glucose-6-phosphate-specific signal transduction histidine kinase
VRDAGEPARIAGEQAALRRVAVLVAHGVRAGVTDGRLVVEVDDDGVGGARAGDGSGLTRLSDRIDAGAGTLRIASPPGRGTTLHASLPLRIPRSRDASAGAA